MHIVPLCVVCALLFLKSLVDLNRNDCFCFPKFQVLVKRYTMERLADIFRGCCLRNFNGSINQNEFEWIPGKILRCLYDKDFG